MFRSRWISALLVLSAASFSLAQEKPYPLSVGDPAPPLTVTNFVKGDPFKSFEKGKVYVVDMWATWCGPCRRSIPEMTNLANKYKDKVQFVGVSIWESDRSLVDPFVKKMGDKMAYSVAVDVWPTGVTNGRDGVTAKTWMEASGMRNIGIPTCFVIGKEGAIEWIGHPDNLATPLDQIVNGSYDRGAFATTYTADMVKLKSKVAVQATYNDAVKKKDWAAAEAAADQLVAMDKSNALTKFDLFLSEEKDRAKALAYGQDVCTNLFKDDADAQTELAWAIAGYMIPGKDAKVDAWPEGLDLALQAAKRAVEINNHKDSTYVMVLAKVYFARGEKDMAVSTQKDAIILAPDPATKESYEKTLKTYGG